MTLLITLTFHITLLAFFNLRQKVYICIYTHFDITKIHKKAGLKKLVTYYLEFE